MTEIRPLKAEDWEEFHEHDLEIFPDDEMKEDSFKRRVECDEAFALIFDGKIIGNLMVSHFGEEGYLGRIGVSTANQGKGFGSILMDYALEWFRKQEGVRTVILNADLNEAALGLYKKYRFKKVGTTWHYFVPFTSLKPIGRFSCQEIEEDEIEPVSKLFPSLPAARVRSFLDDDRFLVLTLKNENGDIVGAARFTPSFPGCFPFEIGNVDCFDDFVSGIERFSLPDFDYLRTVFTNNEELANVCKERKYRLHHRLYKMSLHLE
jgi:ribosomal-protein-alanine N-acetyltransferase